MGARLSLTYYYCPRYCCSQHHQQLVCLSLSKSVPPLYNLIHGNPIQSVHSREPSITTAVCECTAIFDFSFETDFLLSVLPLVVSQSVVFSGGTERRFSFCLVVAARAACAPCDTQSLFFLPFSYRFLLVVYSIKYVQRVADFCRLFTGARLLASWMMMAH